MADGVFNIAKGAARQLADDNADSLVVLLLQANETEADLIDHDNVDALLTAAGNTEATFTNYARKTGLTETTTVDDTGNSASIDVPDQTWTSAGGASNNTLTKLIVAVQTGASDTTLIPISHHDFAVTTDGTDLTAQFDSAGFYEAS